LELLKIYARTVDEKDLLEIKRLLGQYFADKASDLADKLWAEEYEEIIGGDLSPELANFVLETLETLPNVHYIQKYYYWNLISADPDDIKFVDCAVAGSADFIVTNDKHFKMAALICGGGYCLTSNFGVRFSGMPCSRI
jgi:hypothetical protein